MLVGRIVKASNCSSRDLMLTPFLRSFVGSLLPHSFLEVITVAVYPTLPRWSRYHRSGILVFCRRCNATNTTRAVLTASAIQLCSHLAHWSRLRHACPLHSFPMASALAAAHMLHK